MPFPEGSLVNCHRPLAENMEVFEPLPERLLMKLPEAASAPATFVGLVRFVASAAYFAVPAYTAYGVTVIHCLGASGVKAVELEAGLTASSSQRSEPSKALAPKSTIAVKKPLVTVVAALVSGPATTLLELS